MATGAVARASKGGRRADLNRELAMAHRATRPGGGGCGNRQAAWIQIWLGDAHHKALATKGGVSMTMPSVFIKCKCGHKHMEHRLDETCAKCLCARYAPVEVPT